MVISLLFAIAFWLYVDNVEGNTITATYSNIPVEFVGETDTLPNRGLMMVQDEVPTVELELRGPRSVIAGLQSSDLSVQVDLTNISAVGTYPLTYQPLLPDKVSKSSVSVEKASLSTITVRIVEMYEKNIPVRVSVIGEVAENHIYIAEKLVVNPSYITVSGREEDVESIASANLVVDLTDASATVDTQLGYQLCDDTGKIVENDSIRVSDKHIEVTVPVYVMKTLPLTVTFSEAPGSTLDKVDWELTLDSIEVAGEATNLETKDSISLGVVNLSGILSDTEMNMGINLPAGCINLSGFNTTTLSIKFRDLETRTFSVTDITAVGLSENQTFSRVTNAVDVIVRGSAQDLELLTAENIRIVVDLSQYVSNGTYSVPATVLVDGFNRVGAVGTYSIACKIS